MVFFLGPQFMFNITHLSLLFLRRAPSHLGSVPFNDLVSRLGSPTSTFALDTLVVREAEFHLRFA